MRKSRFTVEQIAMALRQGEARYRLGPLDGLIYEYACHEGNYALGNILSGARYQERLDAQDPAGLK